MPCFGKWLVPWGRLLLGGAGLALALIATAGDNGTQAHVRNVGNQYASLKASSNGAGHAVIAAVAPQVARVSHNGAGAAIVVGSPAMIQQLADHNMAHGWLNYE